VRVGTAYGTRNQVTIGLRWETVEVNGAPRPFFIAPEQTPKEAAQHQFEIAGTREQRYAVYHFLGQHLAIKGLPTSRWFTFEP
jgi:hypothetical protein